MTTTLPLKRLVDPSRPITYGIVQAGEDVAGGVPYIRPVDMVGHSGADPSTLRTTSWEIAAAYSRSSLKPGDVVVSIGPSFGKTMTVPDELDGANLTQGTARVAINSEVDRHYVVWALQSQPILDFWKTSVGGATFRALNLGPLAETPIPVPPLDEQRAIADYLDQETAQIDALVAKQEELIGLLRERRRAEVLATIDNIESDRVSLRHFTRVVSGSGFPIEAQGKTGLEYPFFKVKDLKTADANGLLVAPEDSISRETARSLRAVIIPRGSLVFAKVGAALLLGRVGALPVDACIDNNMSGLIFDSSFDQAFARYIMLTFDFRQFVQPGPVPSLSMTGLREFRVPVPHLQKQKEIVRHLDKQTARIDTLIAKAEEHIALAKERRAALITAAVTGQFDVRTARKAG